jgi:hypothetical protein
VERLGQAPPEGCDCGAVEEHAIYCTYCAWAPRAVWFVSLHLCSCCGVIILLCSILQAMSPSLLRIGWWQTASHLGFPSCQWFPIDHCLSVFNVNNLLYIMRLGTGRGVSWPFGCLVMKMVGGGVKEGLFSKRFGCSAVHRLAAGLRIVCWICWVVLMSFSFFQWPFSMRRSPT